MENRLLAFRLKNFMGFKDTGWIKLSPIMLLFGRNSTGKSAIMRALLLLRQSIDSNNTYGPFVLTSEEGVDVGAFSDFIFQHRKDKDVSFEFKIHDEKRWVENYGVSSPWIGISLDFGLLKSDREICLKAFRIFGEGEDNGNIQEVTILSGAIDKIESSLQTYQWIFESDVYDLTPSPLDPWDVTKPVIERGFIPYLYIRDLANPSGLGEAHQIGSRYLEEIREAISLFFHATNYLGPIRNEPQRYYYVPQLAETGVGSHGQHLVRSLLAGTGKGYERLQQVNKWLVSSGQNAILGINQIGEKDLLFSIVIRELLSQNVESSSKASSQLENGLQINLRDSGFGLSQALPVIVESLLAEPDMTVLIEQPELHLHPAAQAQLGDMFIKAVEFGTRFVIETHSSNLIYRFRRRMAETYLAGLNSDSTSYPLSPNMIAAYFIDRYNGISTCEEIQYDAQGAYIKQPEGFQDFFGNDFEELSAMDDARMAAMEKGA